MLVIVTLVRLVVIFVCDGVGDGVVGYFLLLGLRCRDLELQRNLIAAVVNNIVQVHAHAAMSMSTPSLSSNS